MTLPDRVEASAGADRALDAEIAAERGLRVVDEGHPLGRCCYDAGGMLVVLPRYTGGIDAALTLVPNACRWSLMKRPYGHAYHATVWWPQYYETVTDMPNAWAPTAALALCAAALRAASIGGR